MALPKRLLLDSVSSASFSGKQGEGAMANTDFKIEPLFAEPVFRMNIASSISQTQIEALKKLKMVQNQTNLISEDLYIFDRPEFASISKAVQGALDVYAREVLGIPQSLYVTQSWALTNPPGVGMHGHTHSNSVVSGSLYYAPLSQPTANMIFDRHKTYQQIQLKPEATKTNIYNAPYRVVQPSQGDIILFASDIQHLVEPNASQQNRHSIAFNTFVSGTLGDYRNVSELTLAGRSK
jgi:uncharacterized protein (TIGR02466 family)